MKRFFLFFSLILSISPLFSQQKNVMVLTLKDEINASSSWYISKGFEAAELEKVDLIILHLDTYGGEVIYADSIRSRILESTIPTAAYIDKNAASAGALIAIACDSIFMSPGSSIGAATVVNGNTGDAAPDKYQSYWKGIMRSTAEMKNRDPKIAEKMVDQKLDLPGISPVGQVITFSTKEAIEHHYCDGQRDDINEVIAGYYSADVISKQFSLGSVDQIIQFLVNPSVSSFLVLLIFGGLFFELKSPGVGFPGIVAVTATALYFAPHYLYGLADHWEMALFGIGVVLLMLEIFVVPGFGVPGITGIFAVVVALAGGFIPNDGLNFEHIPALDILRAFALTLVSMATAIIGVVWLAKYLISSRKAYPFVDDEAMTAEKGYTAVNMEMMKLIGLEGIAATDLKPSGFIEIEGKKYDAECEEGYVSKGEKIRVKSMRSIHLVVEKI